MSHTAFPHRLRTTSVTATVVIVAVLTIIFGAVGPAGAQPGDDPDGGDSKLDTLKSNLAAAAEGYLKAEAALNASKAKQAEAQKQLEAAQTDIARVRSRVADFAAEAYRNGRMGPVNLLLKSSGPGDVIGRAQAIDSFTRGDMDRLVTLSDAKRRADEAKAAVDAEVQNQSAALDEMSKRRVAAQKALASAQVVRTNPGIDTSGVPIANRGPGPGGGCSVDDPTTSGCITRSTLHALREAQRVGFNWYVSCYRPGNRYEHPKGQACDFAAFPGGFENRSAGGDNRRYGDRLAAFFVRNASALGVMYIVWYCQIWQVGVGWHRYNSTGSSCGDAPAGDHTNHVHLSVY